MGHCVMRERERSHLPLHRLQTTGKNTHPAEEMMETIDNIGGTHMLNARVFLNSAHHVIFAT